MKEQEVDLKVIVDGGWLFVRLLISLFNSNTFMRKSSLSSSNIFLTEGVIEIKNASSSSVFSRPYKICLSISSWRSCNRAFLGKLRLSFCTSLTFCWDCICMSLSDSLRSWSLFRREYLSCWVYLTQYHLIVPLLTRMANGDGINIF